jgi:hypothetical protein
MMMSMKMRASIGNICIDNNDHDFIDDYIDDNNDDDNDYNIPPHQPYYISYALDQH